MPPHFWMERGAGGVIVATEEAAAQAAAMGVPAGGITRTSGMVLHPRFYPRATPERRRAREAGARPARGRAGDPRPLRRQGLARDGRLARGAPAARPAGARAGGVRRQPGAALPGHAPGHRQPGPPAAARVHRSGGRPHGGVRPAAHQAGAGLAGRGLPHAGPGGGVLQRAHHPAGAVQRPLRGVARAWASRWTDGATWPTPRHGSWRTPRPSTLCGTTWPACRRTAPSTKSSTSSPRRWRMPMRARSAS